MNLWERELSPLKESLGRLSPPQRLALAVTALDHAFRTEPVPYEEPDPAHWLEGAIHAGQESVAAGASSLALPPDLDEEFDEIDEEATELGVPQLLMATISCSNFDELSADTLFSIVFSCYVFTAERQDPEPLTIEQEEANERCREVIEYHKELITQAVA